MFQGANSVFFDKIYLTCYRKRHRYIYGNYIFKFKIGSLMTCNKPYFPYLFIINIYQHRMIKFFLFAHQGIKNIFYRGIKVFYYRGLLKQMIKQVKKTADNKKRRQVSDNRNPGQNNDDTQPGNNIRKSQKAV